MNKSSSHIYRNIRVTLCMLCGFASPTIYALDMEFPSAYYCFDQFVLRGGLTNTTLDYTIVIPPDDQLKVGDVFVAFRLKSNATKLWLRTASGEWSIYDGSENPKAYLENTALPPILQLNILNQPTDLTDYSGDGELYVGYGRRLRTNASIEDSYQDMVESRHYYEIWTVGSQSEVSQRLCLNVTGLNYLVGY